MSQYRDMRPLFSGAHRTASTLEYNDQRADFFAMTLVEKRLEMLKAFNFNDYNPATPAGNLAPAVEAFAEQVSLYHRAIFAEANLSNPHSAALITEFKKITNEDTKKYYNQILTVLPLAGGVPITLNEYVRNEQPANFKLGFTAGGFLNLVNSAVNSAETQNLAAGIRQFYDNAPARAYNAPQQLEIFNINVGKLFLKSESGAVVDPALSLIFAESADPEVWVRNSEGKIVSTETGVEAGANNVGNDACAGTKVIDGADGRNCTYYVSDCLMGKNIDDCRAYFNSSNFYNNTIEEVEKMDPMVAVKMLRKFGFKEVSEYDSDRKMNIVTIEPVAKWIEGLTGMADATTIAAISGNEQLKQYLGWIIQLVNRNPAILNPGYRGDLNADSHDPNRFAYTGFAKMGIKARRPVRNSCYRDIDAIANAIDQHNITLGIRLNAPIVGGIVPAKVMVGGSYATISQAETSVAQLKSNRRNTSEILSKTFEYLTNKLQAFHKGISAKDSSKINELINDLAKKEDKLYEVIDFVEKYALLVDVLGEKRVSEVVTVDQMRKAVQARSKLFAKKVKRETDIVSVLRSLTGAVEQETPSGHSHPAGTAAGI